MKDKALRNNLAFMIRELRKQNGYGVRRNTKESSVYHNNGQDLLSVHIRDDRELTKAMLEDLLKNCKPTDYITINNCTDWDGCYDGYSIDVMQQVKQSDSEYYQEVLSDYSYLKNQQKVNRIKLRAIAMGVELTDYQVNKLIEEIEASNEKEKESNE